MKFRFEELFTKVKVEVGIMSKKKMEIGRLSN